MSTKMDDLSEKHDWRRVAVALASVVRPLSHEDELRRGWDAAAERARLAEADAETELRRAERAEADARNAWAKVDALTVRLEATEAAEAARPEAVPVAVPVVDPTGGQAGENERLRVQINSLYADLNVLREKQLDTQARCDKAIQARIEAQRERAAAEKARDEMAAMLADVHSQEGAVKALEYENKFLADRLLSAQKDRDDAIKTRQQKTGELARTQAERNETAAQLANARAGITEHADQIKTLRADLEQAEAARDRAITAGNKYRADVLHNVSEIESLRLKNKRLSDDVERLRENQDDARRARNEARAGLERVQAANAKLAAELAAEREAERAKAEGQ